MAVVTYLHPSAEQIGFLRVRVAAGSTRVFACVAGRVRQGMGEGVWQHN